VPRRSLSAAGLKPPDFPRSAITYGTQRASANRPTLDIPIPPELFCGVPPAWVAGVVVMHLHYAIPGERVNENLHGILTIFGRLTRMKSSLLLIAIVFLFAGCASQTPAPRPIITVNSVPMTAAQVRERINAKGSAAFEEPVVVRADPDVSLREVTGILDALRAIGMKDVTLVVKP